MAEFVQQSIEEMLPELEQMERVGLFTSQEIRQILKRRRNYEYKLRRKTKCKEDYLQYIQYELNVLALVKKRRKRTGYAFKKLEIDIAIVQRIHMLFKLAITRFQDDVKLWMSHIDFCKKRNEKVTVSRLFTKMLQVHNRKPELWILAAKWEFEDNNNPDNARNLLQRGLRFNEGSEKLWTEYYRMELLLTDKIRKRQNLLGGNLPEADEDVSDSVMSGKIAAVVYKMALEAISDNVDIVLSLLDVCRLFDFTHSQEEQMLEDLQKLYPDNPKTWAAVAKTQFRLQEASDSDSLCIDGEEKFHMVFEEATEKVQTAEMWEVYIKACLELVQNKGLENSQEKRIQRTLSVFEKAGEKKFLSPNLFTKWLVLLEDLNLNDKAEEVSERAITCYPTSVDVWHARLRVLIQSNRPEQEVISVFKMARKSVKEKESWPLWELILEYSISKGSEQTQQIFESGLCCCREVCVAVKEMYLQWTYLKTGISSARQLFNRLSQLKPVSVVFYKSYITMELSQKKPDIKLLRKAYEEALRDFGTESPDLWMDYIQLETNHPKGQPENTGKIHFRALKSLEGQLNQEFVTKYTLLQTGHKVS